MSAPYTHEQLATALKAGALTSDQIQALDAGTICQSPSIALQVLRSRGHTITVTTDVATGKAKFQISA